VKDCWRARLSSATNARRCWLIVSDWCLAGELPPHWFFCANTSAKRRFLLEAGGFDERFPRDAHDDAEFGLRLTARGMKTAFVPGALAIHEHPLTLGERLSVMRVAGQAGAIHDSIYPRPHAWNSGDDERARPTWPATRWAWLRHVVRRRESDHAAYYARVLERARLGAYRQAARNSNFNGEGGIRTREGV
jgi:Glycosyl transferase family group 2